MIALFWNEITGAQKYLIYRSEFAGKDFSLLAAVTQDYIYLDSSVEQDKYYYYYIAAVDANGVESEASPVMRFADFSGLAESKLYGEFYNKYFYGLIEGLVDGNVYSKTRDSVPYDRHRDYLFLTDDFASRTDIRLYLNGKFLNSRRYYLDNSYMFAKFRLGQGTNTVEAKQHDGAVVKAYYYKALNLYTIFDSVSQKLLDIDEAVVNTTDNYGIDKVKTDAIYPNFGYRIGLMQKIDWTNEQYHLFIKAVLNACYESSTDKGLKDAIKAFTGTDPYILEQFKENVRLVEKAAHDVAVENDDFATAIDGSDWQWGRSLTQTITDYSDFNAAIVKTNADLETAVGSVSVPKEILLNDDFTVSPDVKCTIVGSVTIAGGGGGEAVVSVAPAGGWGATGLYSAAAYDLSKYPITFQETIKHTSGSCIYGIKKNSDSVLNTDVLFGLYFQNDGSMLVYESGTAIPVSSWSASCYYQIKIETRDGLFGAKYYIRSAINKGDLNGTQYSLLYPSVEPATFPPFPSDPTVMAGAIIDYNGVTAVDDLYIYKANSYLYSSVTIDSQDDWVSSSGAIVRESTSNIDYMAQLGAIQLTKKSETQLEQNPTYRSSYTATATSWLTAVRGSSVSILDGTSTSTDWLIRHRYSGYYQGNVVVTVYFSEPIYITRACLSGNISAYGTANVNLDCRVNNVLERQWSGVEVCAAKAFDKWVTFNSVMSSISFLLAVSWDGGASYVDIDLFEFYIYGQPYESLGTVIYKITQPQTISAADTGVFSSLHTVPNFSTVVRQMQYSNNGASWGTNSPLFDNGTANWETIASTSFVPKSATYARLKVNLGSSAYGGYSPTVFYYKVGYTTPTVITNRIDMGSAPAIAGAFTVSPSTDSKIACYYKYSSDDATYLPATTYGDSIINNSSLLPYRYLRTTAVLTPTIDNAPVLDSYSVVYPPASADLEGIYQSTGGLNDTNCLKLTQNGADKTVYQTVPVIAGEPYILSVFAKSDIDETNNAKIYIKHSVYGYTVKYKNITATQPWTQFSLPFIAHEDIPVQIELSKNTDTAGSVWFDNVRIDHAGYTYNSLARLYIYDSEFFVNDEIVTKGASHGIDYLNNQYITPMFEKSGILSVADLDGVLYRENQDFVVDRAAGSLNWYVPSQTAVETLDQDYDEVNRDTDNALRHASSTTKLGQSFEVSADGKCSKVKLYLSKTGTPAGTLLAKIYDDDAGAPGTVLAISQSVSTSVVTAARAWIEFAIAEADRPTLTAGTTYHLVLEGDYVISAASYIQWGTDSSSPAYGNGSFERYDGANWTADVTTDAIFKVYEYYASPSTQPAMGTQYFVTYSYVPEEIYDTVVNLVKPAHVKIAKRYYLDDGQARAKHDYGLWDNEEYGEWGNCGWK